MQFPVCPELTRKNGLATLHRNQTHPNVLNDRGRLFKPTEPLLFDVLNVVEGNSCQNKLYDPPATRAAAIDQAKYFASEMGADGITNIQCGAREGTSTRTNCWELVSCTAEAIKLAR